MEPEINAGVMEANIHWYIQNNNKGTPGAF
jgi:hypothetical protein